MAKAKRTQGDGLDFPMVIEGTGLDTPASGDVFQPVVLTLADGTTVAVVSKGQQARASSVPVTLSSEDAAYIDGLETLLAAIDAGKLEESTFTDRVGEVQDSPTENTILARLKTIGDLLATIDADTGDIAAIKTALEIMDDWDESDRAKVNLIVGQTGVQGGAGAVSANTQRVAFATDANVVDTELPAAASLGLGDTPVSMPRVGAILRGTYYPSGTNTEYPVGVVGGAQDSLIPETMQYFLSAAAIPLLADDYDSDLSRAHTAKYIATLISKSAVTTDQNSDDQKNKFGHRGVIITLYVSVHGGGNIVPLIQTYSGAHGGWVTLFEGPTITTTGTYVLVLQPGATHAVPGAGYVTGGAVWDWTLPYFWRLYMDHSTADAHTYAASAHLTL